MANRIIPPTAARQSVPQLSYAPALGYRTPDKLEKERSRTRIRAADLSQRNKLAAYRYVTILLHDAGEKVYHGTFADVFGGSSFDGFNQEARKYFRQALEAFAKAIRPVEVKP